MVVDAQGVQSKYNKRNTKSQLNMGVPKFYYPENQMILFFVTDII